MNTVLKNITGAALLSVGLLSTANAALVGRLAATPGGTDYQAYYDNVLDITWLADANAGAGSSFDDGFSATDGRMFWQSAVDWAASLNVSGVTGWRLPTVTPINGSSFNTSFTNDGSTDRSHNISRPGTDFAGSTASELAHMFYNTLGNTSGFSVLGVLDNSCPAGTTLCLVNTGPFDNLQNRSYWIGTEFASNTDEAWEFRMSNGAQNTDSKNFEDYFAWAVHSGDVSAVPVPAAAWLFGSGLLAMLGLARRKTSTV